MNKLVIIGCRSKLVDALLRNFQPWRRRQLFAYQAGQILCFDRCSHALIRPEGGETIEVKVTIAVQCFQKLTAFEKKTDLVFVRHADSTVHLDSFGRNRVRRLAEFRFCEAGDFRDVLLFVVQGLERVEHCRLAHPNFAEHDCGAMLQSLKTADRHAELFALLQVLHRALKRFLSDAQQLRRLTDAGKRPE